MEVPKGSVVSGKLGLLIRVRMHLAAKLVPNKGNKKRQTLAEEKYNKDRPR